MDTLRGIASLWQRLRRSPSGLLGLVLTTAVVATALLAGALTPYDPRAPDFGAILLPPGSPGHPLGTDQLGRDVWSRVAHASRVSLFIGLATVCISALIGSAIGLLTGYFGGRLDTVIMRIADVQLSFPFILVALTVNAILGIGLRNIIVSLVVVGWVVYARVVRGEVLALREREFVQAAAAAGAGSLRILLRHVLPNVLTPIIVLSTLQVAQFIVAEAAISFLGFGVQPPQPSWGNMLAEGKDYVYNAWWLTVFPGLALTLTALGVNLTGDWLRDYLDPRLKGQA